MQSVTAGLAGKAFVYNCPSCGARYHTTPDCQGTAGMTCIKCGTAFAVTFDSTLRIAVSSDSCLPERILAPGQATGEDRATAKGRITWALAVGIGTVAF